MSNRVRRTTGFRRCREGQHRHWALIRRALDAVGRTGDTALTAFTDGCPGLRRILADAGVTAPPMLDWFHLAMRLQHLKQVAGVLSDEDLARGAAKAMIITEVEGIVSEIGGARAEGGILGPVFPLG